MRGGRHGRHCLNSGVENKITVLRKSNDFVLQRNNDGYQ